MRRRKLLQLWRVVYERTISISCNRLRFCQQLGHGFGLPTFGWYTSRAHVCTSARRPHSIASNCECRFYCRTPYIPAYFWLLFRNHTHLFPQHNISIFSDFSTSLHLRPIKMKQTKASVALRQPSAWMKSSDQTWVYYYHINESKFRINFLTNAGYELDTSCNLLTSPLFPR